MRSTELARLAGVSVRTIRHYHQLGVLPEPSRSSNGYRTYGLHDLVRVQRLKHLSAAGLTLTDAGAVLDREDDDGLPAALEAAERALDAQIEQLQRQRDLLAHARALGSPPDVPPELADLAARIAEQAPAAIVDQVRAETALTASVLGVDRTAELQRQLLDSPAAPRFLEAAARFVGLADDAGEDDVRDVARALASAVADLPASYVEGLGGGDGGPATDRLLDLYRDTAISASQARVLELLTEEDRRIRAPDVENVEPAASPG